MKWGDGEETLPIESFVHASFLCWSISFHFSCLHCSEFILARDTQKHSEVREQNLQSTKKPHAQDAISSVKIASIYGRALVKHVNKRSTFSCSCVTLWSLDPRIPHESTDWVDLAFPEPPNWDNTQHWMGYRETLTLDTAGTLLVIHPTRTLS